MQQQALLESDAALVQINSEASDLELTAQTLEVKDEASAAEATSTLGFIAAAKKQLEEKRTFFVKPLNEQVKKINAMFKEYAAPLENADRILRGKVLRYQAEVRRKQQEEEERLRALAEKEQKRLEKQAEKKGLPAPPPLVLPATKAAPKTIQTGLGTATTKTVWDFVIEDEAKIPREYLTVDTKKIRAVVKAGVREIPGVRIFESDQLAVRSR